MSCIAASQRLKPGISSRFIWNRIAVVVVCLTAILFPLIYDPFGPSKIVMCPLHAIIGLPCPSCGMTRAFWMLLRLHFWQALKFNVIGVPLLALFVIAPFVAVYEIFRGVRCTFYKFMYSNKLGKACGAFIIVYHLARVAVWAYDGTLFEDYFKSSWLYHFFS